MRGICVPVSLRETTDVDCFVCDTSLLALVRLDDLSPHLRLEVVLEWPDT